MFNFPAAERLNKHEIKQVFKSGARFRSGFLTLIVLRRESGPGKAGFAVRNARHSAVQRNRCKRMLREIYRLNKHKIILPAWIAVVLTKPEEKLRFSDVEKLFLRVCGKAGVI